MKLRPRNSQDLSWFLAIIVFCVLVFTMAITVILVYLFTKTGAIIEFSQENMTQILVSIAFSSIIIGTLVTLIISRIPLRSIRKFIVATNRVSNGDFSVRLNTNEGSNELRELAVSFNRMAEELSSIEMLRSDFINNFSHEFKTPIVSLRGFAKLLLDDTLPPDERREYLNIIIKESDRLTALATNVLNLSKIESKSINSNVKSFDLSEQIRRCILMLESKWNDKDIDLDLELGQTSFTGNEELLQQVWLNLLDNAIKFSPHGGKVRVVLENSGRIIKFSVTDSGCGMTEETQKHIFDKFYQGDTSHSTEGNGLGLAVAYRIVKLHDGDISVKSAPGSGTTMLVELPE